VTEGRSVYKVLLGNTYERGKECQEVRQDTPKGRRGRLVFVATSFRNIVHHWKERPSEREREKRERER